MKTRGRHVGDALATLRVVGCWVLTVSLSTTAILADGNTLSVDVALRDGSRMSGVPSVTHINLHSSFTAVKIPLTRIDRLIIIDPTNAETNTMLVLRNGDSLSGALELESLTLTTSQGARAVPLLKLASLTVQHPTTTTALERFRVITITGSASVQRPKAGVFIRAFRDTAYPVGTTLRTGEDTTVRITLGGTNTVTLHERTELRVDAGTSNVWAALTLNGGRLSLACEHVRLVTPSLTIEAPQARFQVTHGRAGTWLQDDIQVDRGPVSGHNAWLSFKTTVQPAALNVRLGPTGRQCRLSSTTPNGVTVLLPQADASCRAVPLTGEHREVRAQFERPAEGPRQRRYDILDAEGTVRDQLTVPYSSPASKPSDSELMQ